MSRYSLGTIRATEDEAKKLYADCFVLKEIPFLTEKNYFVAYGFDHACGYFLQLFEEGEDDADNLDYDSLFSGLTGVELGYFLGLFGGNPDHILQAMLDLPF